MTTKQGGVPITGFMSTTDEVDTYATHLDNYGKGGIHSVQDIIERDAITDDRRSEGMLCYIIDDFALYQLSGGITNEDWLLIFTIEGGEVVINNDLPENYIYHGDNENKTIESPILLDVRLDLLRIKAARFVLNKPNEQLLSAQVLSEMQDGYMYNSKGNVTIKGAIPSSDITLSEGMVFRGDNSNMAAEVQRLEFDNLPSFLTSDPLKLLGVYNLYTGSVLGGTPTATLAIQQCNLPNLTFGKIWFGDHVNPINDPFNFGFNRPTEVDKLPTDFLEVPFNKIIIGNGVDRASAQDHIDPEHLPDLEYNHLWIGDEYNRPLAQKTISDDSLPPLSYLYLWQGNENDRPAEVLTIMEDNLPDLTFNTIWRGDISGRPQETNDFTNLELKVETLEDITIPNIEASIAALEGEIAAIQAELVGIGIEIATLQGEMLIVQGAVAVLEAQTQGLLSTVDGIGSAKVILQQPSTSFSQGQALSDLGGGVLRSNVTTGAIVIDGGLESISTSSVSGGLYRTSKGQFETRIITGKVNNINVSNGDGVSGNINISIPDNPFLTGNTTITGDLSVDGTILGKRPAAEFYWIGNNTPTAISAGIWTKIQSGDFAITQETQFTSGAGGTLVFTGESGTKVQLILSCRFRDSVQTVPTIGVSLYKDGVRILASTMYATAFGTDRTCYIGCNTITTLDNSSEIEVYIWAGADTIIRVIDLTLNAFAI